MEDGYEEGVKREIDYLIDWILNRAQDDTLALAKINWNPESGIASPLRLSSSIKSKLLLDDFKAAPG